MRGVVEIEVANLEKINLKLETKIIYLEAYVEMYKSQIEFMKRMELSSDEVRKELSHLLEQCFNREGNSK